MTEELGPCHSWAATVVACKSCRRAAVCCCACGYPSAITVDREDTLPMVITGECPACGTAAQITIASWAHHQPAQTQTQKQTHGALAHLERCIRAGDGQRPDPQQQPPAPTRRPIPPDVQAAIYRLLRGPDAEQHRWPWSRFVEFLSAHEVPMPTASSAAASYRRITGTGPALPPKRRHPALYSLAEFVAVLLELEVAVPKSLLDLFPASTRAALQRISEVIQPYRSVPR